jgi:tetratricopeptide (TPR) repeat protein
MKSLKDIKKNITKFNINPREEMRSKVLDEALEIQRKRKQQSIPGTYTWRTIMKSRITKFAAAVVIIIGVLVGINMLNGTPAWAIEQTVQALKNIQTIIISGTTVYYDSNGVPDYKPFKCWIKLDDKNGNLLIRVESPREIVVVQGNKVYYRRPGSNTVKIFEGQTIQNLKFCYKVMELSPWLNGRILQTLKPLADDWQEKYGKDEKTSRDCVFVNCSYKQLSASFWFVFDIESKRIVEAKHWSNPDYKEPVNLYADSFVYNEDIPDETFNFEIPDGARVIYQNDIENRDELVQKAWELFKDKQYIKALKIYQDADDLFMVGICYDNMGEHEKAIESFEEIINREEDFQGGLSPTYFYLGNSYMQIGQKEKAIEAFENCLRSGKGFRDAEGFPMKNARKYIEKLKNQK